MKNANKIMLIINLTLTIAILVVFCMLIAEDIRLREDNASMKEQLEQLETKSPAKNEIITKAPVNTKEPEETLSPQATEENVETDEDVEPDEDESDKNDTDEDKETNGEPSEEATEKNEENKELDENSEPIKLVFAGDILLSESMTNTYSKNNDKGIYNVLAEELVDEFVNADVAMVNQEFPFSTRGTKMANKQYTFRTNPKYVSVFTDMGIDVVSLANNHTLDYGRDAFTDTFSVLDDAGIEYIGGGDNLDRAKQPYTTEVKGKKITFLAASRVLPVADWYAKENKSGLFQTYDPTALCEEISKAEEYSDVTVVYVHWGKEHQSMPENYQKNMAKQYIDAGADIVIGCHTHCLQGIEFYNEKPIVYSLGNFMFGNSIKETMVYKIEIIDDELKVNIIPCKSSSYKTQPITDEKAKSNFISNYKKICFDVEIDDDGNVKEK